MSSASREPTGEDLVRVPGLPEHARSDPRYLADHAIRRYERYGLAALCHDLGWRCDADTVVTIHAGIGTLVLRSGGSQFTPVWPGLALPAPMPRLAPPDEATRRRRICSGCDRWRDARCQVAGCACAGLGLPDHRFSRCPVGRW